MLIMCAVALVAGTLPRRPVSDQDIPIVISSCKGNNGCKVYIDMQCLPGYWYGITNQSA